ncbi:MAG: ABC transporter ATP-binding protein [Leptolyngbyaceae cyanobacterium bins.302]|nr:ABC transporter ATP-binding protein [Leptolyngbyaceae cyanobacterium bins.302]
MAEVAISLRNVSKCFKRYAHPIDRLKEAMRPRKNYADTFWALHDINLDIAKGETLGVIGRNGSGKSTLLQIIAGTLTPTAGSVQVNGRVSALLELGSGFNPEFTGRQNVFFNGRILGLSQADVEKRLDSIIAFADIGDFLDQPVKTYSSGMFVRLAFAVAIHVEPQILIVDEALAVGDIFFQQKCFQQLDQLKSQGVSILLVSHDMQAIVKLCDRAIILQHGHLNYKGIPSEMAAKYTEMYYSQFFVEATDAADAETDSEVDLPSLSATELTPSPEVSEALTSNPAEEGRYGSMVGLISGVVITSTDGKPQTIFQIGEEVLLSIKINQHSSTICPLNIGFQIKDRLGQVIIGANTCFLAEKFDPELFGKPFVCHFKFQLAIAPEQYTIVVAAAEHDINAQVVYDWIEQAGVIHVIPPGKSRQDGLYQPKITVETTLLSQSLMHS